MVQAMCLRSDFTRAGCQDPALAINVFMHRDDSNRRQAFAFFVPFAIEHYIQDVQI